VCNKGTTQFYLPPTHKPYLPLLPSRKASLPQPVPTYTAWWQGHIGMKKIAQSFYASCPAETQTHDLFIASPTLYGQAPQCHLCVCVMRVCMCNACVCVSCYNTVSDGSAEWTLWSDTRGKYLYSVSMFFVSLSVLVIACCVPWCIDTSLYLCT